MPANRTRELFRDDAYATGCDAEVAAILEGGTVVLSDTVFYYTAGGQPGDTGRLTWNGGELSIAGAVLSNGAILHLPADDQDGPLPAVGTRVRAEIDWARRHALMKMHTSLHLVMAAVPHQINGAQIGTEKSRIDFNTEGHKLDRYEIEDALNAMVVADHPVTAEWVAASVVADNPALVRTMAVEPPRGDGRMRLVRIGDDLDLQPCGGTHVRSTKEIGPLRLGKIDNKGARNKRITVYPAA